MKNRGFALTFLAILVFSMVSPEAQSASNAKLHPQLAALVTRLNAPPTYGGEFRAVPKVAAMDSSAAAPSRFQFQPEKLQISQYDPDQYVIPASVQVTNLTPAGLIKSVHIAVNGVGRGILEWNVSGVTIDQGIHFAIPLFPGDAGTLRLTATIVPKDGTAPEVLDWDYDVPTCRVPEVITYANPPHGQASGNQSYVSFVGDVHGLPKNLMFGFATLVWSQWPEVFDKFDPNQPRDQWSAVINVSSARIGFQSGRLTAQDLFWSGIKGGYAFLIPTACGRYVMSDVQPFFTDPPPMRAEQQSGLKIEVLRNDPGQMTFSRTTVYNAPSGGWIFSWASGSTADGRWGSWSEGLPALVEAKEGPQERDFQYYTFQGFTYSIHSQYYRVMDSGELQLVMDGSTPQNIPGTMPCWFCDTAGKGSTPPSTE